MIWLTNALKKFLYKILAPKPVVSAVPKKDLVIALPYLGKLSLQIRTRINGIMKNKLPYCNIRFVFPTKCKISNLFTFKDKTPSFLGSYVLELMTNFKVIAAMLPNMAKLSVIIKVKTPWNFCTHLEMMMMILPLKNIFYSAITHLILEIF